MTVLSLVREVEVLGGRLIAAGDRLRVSAPHPLPDRLVQELRRHKPELLSFVQDAVSANSANSHPNRPNRPNRTSRATGETGSPSVIAGTRDPEARGEWDLETGRLIEWFLGTEPPDQPFQLQQAVTIVRPTHYWEYLRGDIAAGPNSARGKTGALQDDLRRLHWLFGGD